MCSERRFVRDEKSTTPSSGLFPVPLAIVKASIIAGWSSSAVNGSVGSKLHHGARLRNIAAKASAFPASSSVRKENVEKQRMEVSLGMSIRLLSSFSTTPQSHSIHVCKAASSHHHFFEKRKVWLSSNTHVVLVILNDVPNWGG